MERTLSTEISGKIGQRVRLQGWLYQLRELKNFSFLILRDRRGLVQAVISDAAELEKLKGLQMESVLEIEGLVVEQKAAKGGAELGECKITVLQAVLEVLPVNINKPELDLHLDTLLNHRTLTMRNPKQQAIFKVHGVLQQAFREFMLSRECVEFFPPTLLLGSSEGGAELFSVEYYDKVAKLSQSAQLYKQICIGAYERVFALAKCFRAEKYATSRHLSEATQYEFEMAFIDGMDDVLEFLQETLRFMVSALREKCAAELALIGVEILPVPAVIPRVTMKEAQEIVFAESVGAQDDRAEPDMSPEGERLIGAWARREHNSMFAFITHYPRKKRAFYSMPSAHDETLTDSFDCIGGGFEVASGAVRINDYELLRLSAVEKGIDPRTIEDYLEIFKYGMPMHGGFGLGVERLTQALLGVHNVREVTMFPRDMNRLRP